MSSKLLNSRILYKGFLKTNTSKINGPVKISLNLLENIVEKDIFSPRIFRQSQAHDEIDRSIYTTKSVTKETIVDYVVFLDGCDQFEDKINSLLHCSPVRGIIIRSKFFFLFIGQEPTT